MARKGPTAKVPAKASAEALGVAAPAGKPSALLDTRVVYCGDCLEQLKNLPDACVDLIYIDPPFNSNRNYEVFWGETKEKRAFEDRHASTQAYIDYMRPRCVELGSVLKGTAHSITTANRRDSYYKSEKSDERKTEGSANEMGHCCTGGHHIGWEAWREI